jgi:hypothetical protein
MVVVLVVVGVVWVLLPVVAGVVVVVVVVKLQDAPMTIVTTAHEGVPGNTTLTPP